MDFGSLQTWQRFEELCKQLLLIEYPDVKPLSGRGGDEGTDSFIGMIDKQNHIFQFKYLTILRTDEWTQIRESFEKSVLKKPERYTLLLPAEFSMRDHRKWDELASQYPEIKAEVWYGPILQSKILKHQARLMVTFPELFIMVNVVKTVLDVVTSQAGASPPTTSKAKDPMLNRYNNKILQPSTKVLDRLKLGIKTVNECLRNIETSPLLEDLSVRTVTRLGVFYYYAEKHDDAIFIWNTILDEFPDDLRSLNNKALLLKAGDSQTAINLLEEALRVYPEYLDAKVNLAGILVDSDRPIDAINILEPLVDAHRNDELLLRNLMLAYSKVGNVEKTLECYDWLKDKVSERELQNNIGVAYLHSGKPKDALNAFTRALESAPENAQSKINRAVAMLEMDLVLVPEYILKELHSQRTDTSVMTNLAMVYLKKKQFDLAIAWGLKSLNLNKEDLVALNLVGLGYNSFGDYLEAIRYYDMALGIKRNYLPALGNKANSLMFLARFGDALNCLLEFKQYDPNDKVVNGNVEWLQKKLANQSRNH